MNIILCDECGIELPLRNGATGEVKVYFGATASDAGEGASSEDADGGVHPSASDC